MLSIIVLAPGSPNGCYLELGDYFNKTDGYTFTYIGDGRVFSCNEYADHPWDSGSYRYEDGVGWVFTLRGSHRRALMKPHLLFIRFSDIDAGDRPVTAPFQWRDPFVWKTSPVLRRLKPGASTNSAVLRPDSSYRLPNTCQEAAGNRRPAGQLSGI